MRQLLLIVTTLSQNATFITNCDSTNYIFHNFKFTYFYDHQVNKDVTNISWTYLNITTDITDLLDN